MKRNLHTLLAAIFSLASHRLKNGSILKRFRSIVVFSVSMLITISAIALPIKSGNYPIPGTVTFTDNSTLAVTTIGTAIDALNTYGVEPGATVEFQFLGTYTEIATGRYTIGGGGTALSGAIWNRISFKHVGGGVGHPTLTANQSYVAGGNTTNVDWMIKLLGVDNITFFEIDFRENPNNSNAAGNGSTTSNTTEYGITLENSGLNGCNNNIIKNCVITLYNFVSGASTKNSFNTIGIYQYSNPGFSTTNSNNTYDSVVVTKAYKGIYLKGSTTSGFEDAGNTIKGCIIGGASAGDIGCTGDVNSASPAGSSSVYGLQADYQSGLTVYKSTIRNVQFNRTSNTSANAYGVWLDHNIGTTSFYQNAIHSVNNTMPGSSTARVAVGLQLDVYTGAAIYNIYNNFVGNIESNAAASAGTTYPLFGIRIGSTAVAPMGIMNIYNNSIYLPATAENKCNSALLGVGNSPGGNVKLRVKNNIFKTTCLTGSSTVYSVCFYIQSGATYTLDSLDYNIYDINSATTRKTGGVGSTYYQTLANWKTFTGKDANSQQFLTTFSTLTAPDLSLPAYDPLYKGIFISTPNYPMDIPKDIYDTTRFYPIIGAWEAQFTVPQVKILNNHPSDSAVSKGTNNQVLASIAFNVIVSANTLKGITFGTYGSYTVSPIDFSNIKLWWSTSQTFDSTTATLLQTLAPGNPYGTSVPASSATNLAFNSFTQNLPLGTSYVFVTFYVPPGTATAGHNIYVGQLDTGLVKLNNGTVKTGSFPIAIGGTQTIVDRYYNIPGRDITQLSAWFESYTGTNPVSFTDANQIFNFTASTGNTMGLETPVNTSWTVGGANSKIIVGKDPASNPGYTIVNPVIFEAKFPVYTIGNVKMDVSDSAVVKFQSQYIPTILGTLSQGTAATTGCTIEYGDSTGNVTPVQDTIISASYCNLTLSGITAGSKRIFPANVDVSRTFNPGGFTTPVYGRINLNGTIKPQIIPTNFIFRGLRISNTLDTIRFDQSTVFHNVTVDSILSLGLANSLLTVRPNDTLSLGTSSVVGSTTIAGIVGKLQVDGTVINNNPLSTVFIGNTSAFNTLVLFGANSKYNLSALLNNATNKGQIPPATWDATSTINITNVTMSSTTDMVVGEPAGAGFGNLYFDAPGLAGNYRLFGGFKHYGASGSVGIPYRVYLQGNCTLGRTGPSNIWTVDLGAGDATVSSEINVAKKYTESDGIYRLINNAPGSTQEVRLRVTDDITLSNATQLVINGAGSTNSSAWGFIYAGANFTANSGTTVTELGTSIHSDIIFTKAGTQVLTTNGANFNNDINYTVNNGSTTQLGASSNLTVNNVTNNAFMSLLTGGKFDIAAGNTLTVNGIITTGASNLGTISGTSTSNLLIGGSTTGSVGTVYFTPGLAILNNFSINRGVSAAPSLIVGGTTDLTIHGTLTIGSVTNTNNTIDMGTNAIAAGGSFATNIATTGTLKTQHIATTLPLPAGYNWGGTVMYNAAGAQTMVNGNFNILNGNGGNRTLSPTGTIGISGATNPTCFIPGAGAYSIYNSTIDFNGSGAQNVPAFMYENMVSSNSTSTKSLVGNISIKKSLTLSNSTTLSLGANNLSLLSSDTLTARLNPVIQSAGLPTITYGTGLAFVQRYFPAQRKWRLITTPVIPAVASTPTISVAWQEGQVGADSSSAGFWATKITGGSAANGFDPSPNNNTSIKYFNAGSWLTPANTNSTSVKSMEGWMLFVRGDRKNYGLVTDQYKAPTVTTLRPRGQLFIGSKTIAPGTAGYAVIGNPYASAIDFNSVYASKTGSGWPSNATYVVWDPTLGGSAGQGAFVTFTWNGSVFLRTSPYGAGGYDSRYIPSSAAILVNFPAGGGLTINETDKNTANTTTAFRPMAASQTMLTVLNTLNPDNSTYVSDGALSIFDNSFNNGTDVNDAIKLGNFSENFGLMREGKVLSIERMKTVKENDTIFYYIGRMQQKKYQLQFIMDNLNVPASLTAFLEDTYLKTKTAVSLQDTTRIDFNVSTDAASTASDRFRLIFKRSVKYTHVNAYVLNSDIAVEWNIAEELDINKYIIERSVDGINFTKAAESLSKGNSGVPVNYNWLDASPEPGVYYYRIKSISNSGVIAYSETVKVNIVKGSPVLYVFPNPVTNNTIQLQLNSALPGKYSTRLTSSGGQLINAEIVTHTGGTATKVISPLYHLSNGNYQLEVTSPDKKVTVIKVLVNGN